MKKIAYLHGLESKNYGSKVQWLSSFSLVYSPYIDYNNFDYDELLSNIRGVDLVIGSSMGGYVADIIGSQLGVEVLLLNPALHSRSININYEYGNMAYKRNVVLGMKDDIINPIKTKDG